jgi:hypothetical protein
MRINHLTFRVIGWVLFVSIFLTASRSLATDDTNQWKVQVTSLQIVMPITMMARMEGKTNLSEKKIQTLENLRDRDDFSSGVTVNLQIFVPDGEIVDDNFADSAIESFTDDKGKNLLPDKQSGISTIGFNTHGASSLSVKLKAPNLPSKGASELNIIGKIVAKTASQSKQFTVENVNLKAGAKFNLGDLQISVSNPEKQDGKFAVTFDSDQDLATISSFEVFDKLGKQINASLSNSGTIWNNKTHVVELSESTLTLDKRLDSAKIVATCWTDLKTVEVPLAVKVDLGL